MLFIKYLGYVEEAAWNLTCRLKNCSCNIAEILKGGGGVKPAAAKITGTVRFELTTSLGSTRFQDERHKPDSTKYPCILPFHFVIRQNI